MISSISTSENKFIYASQEYNINNPMTMVDRSSVQVADIHHPTGRTKEKLQMDTPTPYVSPRHKHHCKSSTTVVSSTSTYYSNGYYSQDSTTYSIVSGGSNSRNHMNHYASY